jgi:hypothetical protein
VVGISCERHGEPRGRPQSFSHVEAIAGQPHRPCAGHTSDRQPGIGLPASQVLVERGPYGHSCVGSQLRPTSISKAPNDHLRSSGNHA